MKAPARLLFFAALAVTVLALIAPSAARSEGGRVAVFPVKNNGNPQYNGLATGLAAMFTTNMSRSEAMQVIEPQTVAAAMARFRLTGGAPGVADALNAAASLDADYAIMGEFLMFGGRFRIDLHVYDVKAGQVKFSEKAQDKEEQFFPKVDELSDKIIIGIAGTLPRAKATLQINSVPAGAQALIDEEKSGETPTGPISLAPGQHTVALDMFGYHPYEETVVLAEGEIKTLDITLVPLYGGVRIWWRDLPTSDVSLGETVIPASTFKSETYVFPRRYCRNMPAGTYKLSVRMPYKDEASWDDKRSWKTYTEEIDIEPGEVVDVYLFNKLFEPGVQVSNCGACANDWDFDTRLVWYEEIR